jgi:hypothetical protein
MTDAEPLPVWLAALMASGCEVRSSEGARQVDWRCISGRAVYTNRGAGAEVMLPFNLDVRQGETVTVAWLPGESGYTVELYEPDSLAA